MKKVRWAFINASGSIVRRVVLELINAENAELVAVCSRDMKRARAFADEYGVKDAYDNDAAMLQRDDIDIVYIGLPNYLHAEYSIKCMNAGKGVLCEKPMARSYKETQKMIECAKENETFLMEGLWMNFFPAIKKTHEWIKQGKIGKPLLVHADFGVQMPKTEQSAKMAEAIAWRMNRKQGGGALSDLGIYCVALACDVMGAKPDEIKSFAQQFGENGSDVHSATVMRHGAESFSHISSSFISKMPTKAVVCGEKGSIIIGDKFWQPDRAELFIGTGDPFFDEPADLFVDEYLDKKHEGFKYEIEAASKYVAEGKTQAQEVSWDYSLRLSRVMDAVRASWGR